MKDSWWTPDVRKRLGASVLMLLMLLCIFVTPLRQTLFENRLLTGVDEGAEEIVDDSFQRALAAFALARATNAVISVIQGSQIEATPAGVGVSIALGEALDPINDLVERFSWVMLVALTSLGIQKVFIEVAPWLSVQLLGALSLALWLLGVWVRAYLPVDLVAAARTLVVLALVVRFAVPAMAWVNQRVYDGFLASRYEQATAAVQQETERLKAVDPSGAAPEGGGEGGWWTRFRDTLAGLEGAVDLERALAWAKGKSARLIENFLSLIVVFMLNTILLPLAFLWGLFRLLRLLGQSGWTRTLERVVAKRINGGGRSGR